MFCPKCGHELPESSKFCPQCGQYIKEDPSAFPNQEAIKQGASSKRYSRFGTSSLKIALAVATVAILVIVLLIGGIGRSSEKSAAGNDKATNPTTSSSKVVDAAKNQEDQAKAKLDEADSAFSKGDYDTALRLYRDIDTDYAKARVHAIECIPVADSVAKEWLESTNNTANEVLLAAFDFLSFRIFETSERIIQGREKILGKKGKKRRIPA